MWIQYREIKVLRKLFRNIENQQVHQQERHLRDYQLSKDRERRQIRPLARYSYADLVFSALVAGAKIKTNEPSNFDEAMQSDDSTKWM